VLRWPQQFSTPEGNGNGVIPVLLTFHPGFSHAPRRKPGRFPTRLCRSEHAVRRSLQTGIRSKPVAVRGTNH